MSEYVITTENTCDLPKSYYKEHGIPYLYLTCQMDGISYNKNRELDEKTFYDMMRSGTMPTTSQVNVEDALELFEDILKQGKDILHIGFSSGLSGSYNSTCVARQELIEKYPERKIIVIDSLCASMGEGLLLDKAIALRDEGKSIEEVADWVENNKLNVCHVFTPDDLFHLQRGGRVSKSAAIIGTMINIKPILHVDNEGHLINISKIRGRKKALQQLVKVMEENIGSWREKPQKIFISHGDCEEDAKYVADLIREKFGYDTFLINYIGTVIGAHTGAGIIALFFMGDQR